MFNSVKVPRLSVIVPNDVFANTTLTPISGALVSDEMTKPETLPVVPG